MQTTGKNGTNEKNGTNHSYSQTLLRPRANADGNILNFHCCVHHSSASVRKLAPLCSVGY